MKTRSRVVAATICLCIFGMLSVAYAESFVLLDSIGGGVKTNSVDVDSIRQGDDGLVYYTERRGGGNLEYRAMGILGAVNSSAVDCQKHILYTLSIFEERFKTLSEYPDWRSKGNKVVQGSHGALLENFVCSRVKK
jgi:hypothetical protein